MSCDLCGLLSTATLRSITCLTKSSHGGDNVLNQSLMHSKYAEDTAKHFDTNYVEIY